MNYETIRELLLKTKVLSKQDAIEILTDWMQDNSLYYRFLTEGTAVALNVYTDYDVDACRHVFEPTDIFVLSPRFAQLFFNVKDNAINALFASVINQVTFGEEGTGEVYAWPYLTIECIKDLNEAFLLNLIEDIHFVFDFSVDTDAKLYDCLYHKIYNACECDGLLPINSFNLSPKWLEQKNGCNMETLLQNFFMVNCGFGDGVPDAAIRKLFIQYFMRSSRQIEEAYQHYLSQNN